MWTVFPGEAVRLGIDAGSHVAFHLFASGWAPDLVPSFVPAQAGTSADVFTSPSKGAVPAMTFVPGGQTHSLTVAGAVCMPELWTVTFVVYSVFFCWGPVAPGSMFAVVLGFLGVLLLLL